MKELYSEGLASHGGPESCANGREAGRKALTGVCIGRVLSPSRSISPANWPGRSPPASPLARPHRAAEIVALSQLLPRPPRPAAEVRVLVLQLAQTEQIAHRDI
jgi:hypothetical protein